LAEDIYVMTQVYMYIGIWVFKFMKEKSYLPCVPVTDALYYPF